VDDEPDVPSDDLSPEPTDGELGHAQARGGGGPRASDVDRNRFAKLLERHFVDGRLSDEEFSDRMDRVLQARTLGELYALSADLPDLPAVEVPRQSQGTRRHPWRFWRT
jgi:hypothetical protein